MQLLTLIKEEFDWLGWMLTFQPPNSPPCNCDDSAVFPALAKKGTALGGLLHYEKYLECEELWGVVKRAWDEYPGDSIARAFIHHSQVAAAINEGKGDDGFLKGRAHSTLVCDVCVGHILEREMRELIDLISHL